MDNDRSPAVPEPGIRKTEHGHSGSPPPLVLRSPEDCIAAVPYLLGFHPQESIVAIGTDGPYGTCALRLDLPDTAQGPDQTILGALGERVAELLSGNAFARALLIGYGPEERVGPAVAAARTALGARDIEIFGAMRVEDGRWWSYTCHDPQCCPPEGTVHDITTSVVAAQATLEGQVALTDRAEFAQMVAPLSGPARGSLRRATDRAEERFLSWIVSGLSPEAIRQRMVDEGVPLIEHLYTRARRGDEPPDDDEIAWLGVCMTNLRVRDEAWVRIEDHRLDVFIDFWRDVLCRVEEPYAAAPASLLAYTAYASGNGGLANVALDRALDCDSGYSLAYLLRDMINTGMHPSEARLGMTSEELAALYGDREQDTASAAYPDGPHPGGAGTPTTGSASDSAPPNNSADRDDQRPEHHPTRQPRFGYSQHGGLDGPRIHRPDRCPSVDRRRTPDPR